MSSVTTRSLIRAVRPVLVLALLVTAAFGGPPLICHPFEIGAAKSLPAGPDWHGVSRDYDRTALSRDTLALLTPATPILVRMETLRRAAIYATAGMRAWNGAAYSEEDRAIALALLSQLQERARTTTGPDRALALFDAGYFLATLRETRLIDRNDGYDLLVEADQLRGGDPEIQFALALATERRPVTPKHHDHLQRARAGAARGSLLAINLSSHFASR